MNKIIYIFFCLFFLFSCFGNNEDSKLEEIIPNEIEEIVEEKIEYSQDDLYKECESIINGGEPLIIENTPYIYHYNKSKMVINDLNYSSALKSRNCDNLKSSNDKKLCEAYLTGSLDSIDIQDVGEYDYYLYKSLILNEDFCDDIKNDDVEQCKKTYLSTLDSLDTGLYNIYSEEILFYEDKKVKENYILKYGKEDYLERINKEFLSECKKYVAK